MKTSTLTIRISQELRERVDAGGSRMKTCPAAAFGCSCTRCVKPEPDLTALKQFNRATYTTSLFLILLAVFLGVFAVGLWKTEQTMERTAIARKV